MSRARSTCLNETSVRKPTPIADYLLPTGPAALTSSGAYRPNTPALASHPSFSLGSRTRQIGMALFVVLYALDAFGLWQLRYRPLHQPA